MFELTPLSFYFSTGGDGRKQMQPSQNLSNAEHFKSNKKIVKKLVDAFDEGIEISFDAVVGTSSDSGGLKIDTKTDSFPTPPLTPGSNTSTSSAFSSKDKTKMEEMVVWMTDLDVQESDAQRLVL